MDTAELERIFKEISSLKTTKLITKRTQEIALNIFKRKNLSLDTFERLSDGKRYNIGIALDKLNKFTMIIRFDSFQVEQCSCGHIIKRSVCLHVALVILALQNNYFIENLKEEKTSEKDGPEPETKSIEEVRTIVNTKMLSDLAIPPTVTTVLDEMEKITEIFMENGSQRVNHTALEWLNTLIIRARTHKLIKIEKTLKKLQNILIKYLEKSSIDEEDSFLSIITELHNYIQLTNYLLDNPSHPFLPTVAILGQARSEYFPVDDIDYCLLLGVSGWISDAGMVGVTAFFMNPVTNENVSGSFFTANNVRPIQNMPEASAIMLYGFKTYSEITFKDMAKRSLYEIRNVKFNHNKNLSLHKQLSLTPLETDVKAIKTTFTNKITFSDWNELLGKLQNKDLSPIETQDYDMYYILEPAKYVSFELDYISQKWKAPLIDKNGKLLYLVVPNETTPHVANKIKNFQHMFKEDWLPNALFGKLDILENEVVFNPISGWFYQGFTTKAKYGVTINRITYNFDVDIGAEYIFG